MIRIQCTLAIRPDEAIRMSLAIITLLATNTKRLLKKRKCKNYYGPIPCGGSYLNIHHLPPTAPILLLYRRRHHRAQDPLLQQLSILNLEYRALPRNSRASILTDSFASSCLAQQATQATLSTRAKSLPTFESNNSIHSFRLKSEILNDK
jgi:hypothetical protein